MKKFIRALSVILSVFLLVQVISVGAAPAAPTGELTAKSAAKRILIDGPEGEPLLTEEQAAAAATNEITLEDRTSSNPTLIVGEVEEERTEDTKHYLHLDGTFTAALHSGPIHYLDAAGKWQNINNTLSLDSSKRSVAGLPMYTPAASGLDIRIPQDFGNDQKLTVTKNGYTVGMGLKAQGSDVRVEPVSDDDDANAISDDTLVSENNAAAEGLAERKTIDLSAVRAEVNNDLAAEEAISDVGTEDEVTAANAKKMKLDNLSSSVLYRDIFLGADLQYILTSTQLKEYITVKELQGEYTYLFDLSLGGLLPVPQEDGSINLYVEAGDEEPLFILEAPYMYDANDEYSTALQMTLADDGTLTLTADAAWINDEGRALPVTIDPTLTLAKSSIDDAYISTAAKNTTYRGNTYNYAGSGLLGTRRTYMKFTLPTLPDGSVVINASLKLVQNTCFYYNAGNYLYAYDLTNKGYWSPTSVTWNNQPVSGNINGPRDTGVKAIDYNVVNSNSNIVYLFNLTKEVKNWYENSSNNGLMFATYNEGSDTQSTLYTVRYSSNDSYLPIVTIEYNTNIGLEDYWSYEAIDLGRSGAAYVNDYNGSLTYVHSDLAMTGNRLPISLSHVYNSNNNIYGTYYSGMNVGAKFHLSIQELLIPISSSDGLYSAPNNYRFKHYDADGTLHYYRLNGSKTTHVYDEKLEVTTSGVNRIITDTQGGNKKYFNSAGQLFEIEDSNGNKQTYTFSGNRITQIMDGARDANGTNGRTVQLAYNAYNQLESIKDPAGRFTYFTYSSTASTANLTSITRPGNKTTSFQYVSTNHISRITADNNSFATFSYKYTGGCGYRVSWAYQYDKVGAQVDSLQFQYSLTTGSGAAWRQASGFTIVTNKIGKQNMYHFDAFGRSFSVRNQDQQSQYSVYWNDVGNKFNKPAAQSELQTVSSNLLRNHGFEQTANWQYIPDTGGQLGYSTAFSSNGLRSMRMSDNSTSSWNHVCQGFVAEPGQTYTLSADFYIPNELQGNGGAILGFGYNDTSGGWHHDVAQPIKSTNGWERHSFTFTFPTNTANNGNILAVITQSSAAGEFYFDNVQLEKSGGARNYNLVENSNFSYGTGTNTAPWVMTNAQSGDGVYVNAIAGCNELDMSGSPEKAKKVTQTVLVNAQPGDTLVIGGQARAYATVDTANVRKFSIIAEIYSTNSKLEKTLELKFDRAIPMETQAVATYYTLPTDCYKVVYSFVYYYHTASVAFDSAFVYVGNFGEHYDYSPKGQLSLVENDESGKTEYTYSGTKLTGIDQTTSGITETVADIEYFPNSYNVKTITNNVDAEIEYTYTPAGQVTSQTVTTAEGEETVESTTYIQGGNYPKTFTDANGGVTTYAYDNNDQALKGLVVKVQDPNGNETTYSYDANTDELLSTTGKANPSTPVTTSLTMQDHLPKTVTRNGTVYSYDYDNQNRVTGTKVGSQTLMSNNYDSRRRLSQQTYANGAYYTPMYDSRDRLLGEKWNNVQTAEYFYNENDRLSQAVDKITGVAYKYDYAFFGLLNKVTGTDGTLTAYDYDMSGNLSHLTFSKNNDTIYQARYVTDEKGNVEDVILGNPLASSNDVTALHYNYDQLGRLTGNSVGPLASYRTYLDGANSTTNRVEEYTNEDGNGIAVQQYAYTYDANGNILTISDGGVLKASYVYDGLNRLTRENNVWANKSYAYNYDAGGNLTTVTTHAYTTGILGAATATENYAYGNANWKDQLTSHCGGAITYDALGNPVAFVGYTLTWDKGSQLTSFSGNGLNITYTYDASGRRTKQVANGTTINYIYSGDLLMRQSEGANTLDFQYDASGKAVGFKYNGTVYYYLRNLQSDIVAITDIAGNVVGSYTYDAWGNVISYSGAIASINPIRYRGYYQDPLTGWYFLNSRYYSSGWRRFLNADALFIAGDPINASNMYAYCNGNPVNYIDSNGMAPTWYGDLIGNGLRVLSKAAGWLIRRPTERFFQNIADPFLAGIKVTPGFGEDFATSWVCQNLFLPAVEKALYDMFDIDGKPKSNWTFDMPSGLRHIFFANMSLGAPYAEYFLGFEPDNFKSKGWFGRAKTFKNYTTVDILRDKYMWQQELGYTTMYDMFFSMGGPIQRLRYEFAEGPSNNKTYYCIWLWKGDYWNLGAGAEIGIYSTKEFSHVENHFYQVDPKLNLHVRMKLDYSFGVWPILSKQTINDFHQTMWWVCSFTPEIQKPRIDRLDVDIYARFVDRPGDPAYKNNLKLMEPFYKEREKRQGTKDAWTEVTPSMSIANKSRPVGHTGGIHQCGKRPELCTCTCTTVGCGNPCRYYTYKCVSSDYRCEHYNDSDNGFQFRIQY